MSLITTEEEDLERLIQEESKTENSQKMIDAELLDDEITYTLVCMKVEMMDYIRYEKVPLLQFFDNEIWSNILRECLK